MAIPTPNMVTPRVVSTILTQKRWAPSNLRRPEKRSSHWRAVRKAHLLLEPTCRMCGGTEKLQVHHMLPFHLHPERELQQENLITLCEKPGHDCHFVMGHFHNWSKWNPSVRSDSTAYLEKQRKASE